MARLTVCFTRLNAASMSYDWPRSEDVSAFQKGLHLSDAQWSAQSHLQQRQTPETVLLEGEWSCKAVCRSWLFNTLTLKPCVGCKIMSLCSTRVSTSWAYHCRTAELRLMAVVEDMENIFCHSTCHNMALYAVNLHWMVWWVCKWRESHAMAFTVTSSQPNWAPMGASC